MPSLDKDPLKDPSLRGPGLWRTLQESFGSRRRLLDVAQIEVTSLCPGGCLYCPHTTTRDQWKSRNMEPETFARLWPLLLEARRVHLQGWGEPLLHSRFFDMAALARRADCLVSTTTCGLRMNEEIAARLVDSGLDIVAFSLTGATAASNNQARSGVDFDRVLSAIRTLQEVRRAKMGVHLEVHLAYLMLASQVDEALLLPDLMHELGVHAAVVSTLDYLPAPKWRAEAFFPQETAKVEAARRVLKQAAARARELEVSLFYSLPRPDPAPACLEDPSRSVYVDAEGNISPCIYVNLPTETDDPMRRVFGSCLRADPVDIWRGHDFEAFRKALVQGAPDAPCRDCPKRFAVGNRSS